MNENDEIEKNRAPSSVKIERFLSEKVDKFSNVYSNIKFFMFAFSIVTIIGFLLVYGFLYGYYFSGNIDSTISSFNVISNFVPFDLRTFSMTSFFFICVH